jgi:(1->4)-alpha-D-glucan 1-alpha-D-glucosylmutase
MPTSHDLADALLAEVVRRTGQRRLPEATYRQQFHAGFTFQDARAVIPYLHDLGISHCYASPYLKARPGSTHGYDIIDHRQINPEIGSPQDHAAWVESLREHGLGQILDMVPNHMGVASNDNSWWNDVLENGPASPYASWFDISWEAPTRPELRDRVLLPVLGAAYGKVLESGQLHLSFEAGTFSVSYYDRRFPLDPRTWGLILRQRLEELERTLGADSPALLEYQSILTAVGHLPARTETEPAKVAERQREKEVIKRRLATLVESNEAVRAFLNETLVLFNGKPGEPASFDLLDKLLDEQAYRLSFWRVASDEINYRRFFDVNDLAALSMEREDVFAAAHELVFHFLGEGTLHGLRIDHPDGLYDPRQYLERLQRHYLLSVARTVIESDPRYQGQDWELMKGALLQRITLPVEGAKPVPERWPLYVVVEKILGSAEALPDDLPGHGTSGYDFLNAINALFVNIHNGAEFTRLYRDMTGQDTSFAEMVYQKKYLILQVALSSELHMLGHQLDRLAQKHRSSRDFTLNSLRYALRATIACFPVYRSYISDERGVRPQDRRYVEAAIRLARVKNPTLSWDLFRFIRDTLLSPPESTNEADRPEQRHFAGKFQQVTSPVMAKGVEDTAFYVYNRLLSLNEVGGDPVRFGTAPEALHRYLQARQEKWPYSLSPLSTHDTKRGEDVRARLNVLSEMPEEWRACVERWHRINEPHRQKVDEAEAPDANEEYLLYQTLIGAWPLAPYTEEEYGNFVRRISEYMVKALHEAKVHSSWINPDTNYDEGVGRFIARILDPSTNGEFLADFRGFQEKVSHLGLLNSLAQTLLRIAAPGVPDTYQGTELWDFSLVDPDNRRPVDYERRARYLKELQNRVNAPNADRRALARDLLETRMDGRIKLYVTWQALCCRRDRPGLFSTGEYLPAEVVGSKREQAFGFVRRLGDQWSVVVVPRLLVGLNLPQGCLPLGPDVWQDTRLVLPGVDPNSRWRNVFTGEVLEASEHQGKPSLALGEVFACFPVALFIPER